MAGSTLAAGVLSYSSTIAVASTTETVTFVERYNYVAVTNDGTTNAIYVNTAGGTVTDTGNQTNAVTVPPGATVVIANQLPLWFQSSKVIPAGSAQIPQGAGAATVSPSTTVLSTVFNPGETQPYMSSGQGQKTNPGTSVALNCAGTNPYTVTAVG
jgi:hypothetical protein